MFSTLFRLFWFLCCWLLKLVAVFFSPTWVHVLTGNFPAVLRSFVLRVVFSKLVLLVVGVLVLVVAWIYAYPSYLLASAAASASASTFFKRCVLHSLLLLISIQPCFFFSFVLWFRFVFFFYQLIIYFLCNFHIYLKIDISTLYNSHYDGVVFFFKVCCFFLSLC